MAGRLHWLLLLEVVLPTALAFNITVGTVMDPDPESPQIVSDEYWTKFSEFMQVLTTADFSHRLKLLTIPGVNDFLVPKKLLAEMSAHLTNTTFIGELVREYQEFAGINMTLLGDKLVKLGNVAIEYQVPIPGEVKKKLIWRALVRPHRQEKVAAWLDDVLDTFFGNEEALEVQKTSPDLFEEYLLGAFEFDWMDLEKVLEDSIANSRMRAEMEAERKRKQEQEKLEEEQQGAWGGEFGAGGGDYGAGGFGGDYGAGTGDYDYGDAGDYKAGGGFGDY